MNSTTSPNGNPDQSLVISFLTLRKAVGVLGIFLPIGLAIGVPLLSECKQIQDSISNYYYTKMNSFMVGTLCAVSLFLFSYKGYERRDTVFSKLACIFALGVALFPTKGPNENAVCNFLHRNGASWVSTMHNIFAALFFLTLAYFCLFLFTKTSGNPTSQKMKRNVIYKTCGYIILASVVLLFLYFQIDSLETALEKYKPVFILETLALWAFGFSWLIKGEFLLKDK